MNKEGRIRYLNFCLRKKVLIKNFHKYGVILNQPKDRIIEEMLNIK